MDTYAIVNLTANVFCLLTLIVLIVGTLLGGELREKTTQWFFLVLIFVLIGVANEMVMNVLDGVAGDTILLILRIAEYLSYFIWSLQVVALNGYVYEYLKRKTRVSPKVFYVASFFGLMAIVFATIAQFNGMYAVFDEMNRYHQQDTFWIATIFPSLAMAVYTFVILQNRQVLKIREWGSFLFYVVVFISFYALTYYIPELWIAYVGAVVALLVIYVNIQLELKQQLVEQRAQLNENHMALMLSQIQPHFLYNTLTAISGQCKESPQAQQSILLFSQYLRGNMDSLSQKTPIPFEDELKHTKQYLRLEKLRFGERLQVDYDIETIDFMLPVLSLQPLVENAVRHGVTKTKEGGTIIIRTKETKHDYYVVVEDDGIGFVPEVVSKDGLRHVGIENVRSRLAVMCGGTLAIESTIGIGTRARIQIPKGG